jgi:hypothetical protein
LEVKRLTTPLFRLISRHRVAGLFVAGLLLPGVCPAGAEEPLRVRRNLFGMHNLKDGGPDYRVGMDWTRNLVGSGYVFDWVTDPVPWVQAAFERNLIPCIRVQECNGGCNPSPGYAGQVASTILNYKLANPQYADRLVYLQLWNEPNDPRDKVPPGTYADYLVNAYNTVRSVENGAAASNPNVARTMLCMTPGQNGPSWWEQAFAHNPNAKFAFDVWGTHPYPEATPPHYNLHDGDVYKETSKTIDSYLMDLDVIAAPHGNPPKSRRGFRVMITETAYGDHLGISYEGWPKTNRQMAADYNVSAFGTFWYQWPEIVAVQPFLLSNLSWQAFSWVQAGSGTSADGSPTHPWPQFTATRARRLELESLGQLAPARISAYRGPVGRIAGTITRADTGGPVKYATIFTDGYEFGNVSLYDGGYAADDVPVGTYTLSVQKVGYQSISRQISVTEDQTTLADFALTYVGRVSKGFYFVDTFNGDAGCSGCSLFSSVNGQTFKTPSDVAFLKYVACKPNVDGLTMKFSILQGGPTGPQVGSSIYATLEPGVGGNMIGNEWPDGQEPAVQPNTTYFLKMERTDGAGVYCYASGANPYPDGQAYVGGSARSGVDFYAVIRGLTAPVNLPPPTISRAPTVLAQSVQRGFDADAQTFTVANSATNDSTLQYSISDNAGWLSVAPAAGVCTNETDVITVNYATASLPAGTYQALVTITDPAATNNPQTIAVTLTIQATIPGDMDNDGDVDQSDFGFFQRCLTAPGSVQSEPACLAARIDGDPDVDIDDFGLFQRCMSGANIPAEPDCAEN